jgi:CDP-4-dehydro-6-deoxyglucose reductase, E1
MYWPLMHNSINWRDKYELIKFILLSDRFTNGPKVRQFEQAWADWVGSKRALYVSSGSTANFLLLAAVKELYKIPDGAKILLPACTWVTNVSPAIQLGFKPVWCDISLKNFSFDLENLPKDQDIKVVFVTHLLGIDAPIEQLKQRYPNALFLEDICESHGVSGPDGRRRGSESLGSTFSFYYGHHMTTIEGGMICTNDEALYELMRLKRSHGMAREMSGPAFSKAKEDWPDIDGRFLFLSDGYNFRNTEIGAVLGLSQLKRLDDSIWIRKMNYRLFTELLMEFTDHFYMPDDSASNSSFCLPLICKNPALMPKLKKAFDDAGIENRPIVGGNLLRQPFLAAYKNTVTVPNADILNDNGVYVGNSQFVTPDMIFRLIDIIRNVINEADS